MSQVFRITKRVDKSVQPWMDDNDALEVGDVVYSYNGHTYGCIGDGIAVTREADVTPFMEVPRDSVEPCGLLETAKERITDPGLDSEQGFSNRRTR